MKNSEIVNFGYVPMVAEWKSYLNKEKTITFNQLCFGTLQLVVFYENPNIPNGEPKFKVEGLAFNVKRDFGYFQTEEEASEMCIKVAKHIVSKIKDGKKILTFIE